MLVRSSKLSGFKIKEIIWSFCVDIDATKTNLIASNFYLSTLMHCSDA